MFDWHSLLHLCVFSFAWSSLLVTVLIFLISSLSLSYVTFLFFLLNSGLPSWISLTCCYFLIYSVDYSMLLTFCSWSWVEFIYFIVCFFKLLIIFFTRQLLKSSSVTLSISVCVSFIVKESSWGLTLPWFFMCHVSVLWFAHLLVWMCLIYGMECLTIE